MVYLGVYLHYRTQHLFIRFGNETNPHPEKYSAKSTVRFCYPCFHNTHLRAGDETFSNGDKIPLQYVVLKWGFRPACLAETLAWKMVR